MSKVSRSTWLDPYGNQCTRRSNGRLRVQTVNNEPSMTIQSEKDNCDINKIVAKFKSTGLMTNVVAVQATSGDFSDIVDYQTACNAVIAAEDAFSALPATIRKRFDNSPGQFLAFIDDANNRSEAISLGLIPKTQSDIPAKLDEGVQLDNS